MFFNLKNNRKENRKKRANAKTEYCIDPVIEISKPKNWRQLKVNAVISISGVYVSKNNAGLLIKLTHLQFDPQHETPRVNPFSLPEDAEFDSIII